MANISKNIQKISKCSKRNTQKLTNTISQIFRRMHIVPNPPSFLEEEWNEKFKIMSKSGGQFLKK